MDDTLTPAQAAARLAHVRSPPKRYQGFGALSELNEAEQLKRALALSTLDTGAPSASRVEVKAPAIMDEQAELRRILELSKTDTSGAWEEYDPSLFDDLPNNNAVASGSGTKLFAEEDLDSMTEEEEKEEDEKPAKPYVNPFRKAPAQTGSLEDSGVGPSTKTKSVPNHSARPVAVAQAKVKRSRSRSPSSDGIQIISPPRQLAPKLRAATRKAPTPVQAAPPKSSSSTVAAPKAAVGDYMADRAEMEKQRAERARAAMVRLGKAMETTTDAPKRKLEDGDHDNGTDKRRKLGQTDMGNGGKVRIATMADLPTSSLSDHGSAFQNGRPVAGSSRQRSTGDDEVFWDGEIRPTWNIREKPRDKTFRMEHIFGDPDSISLIISAAFCWDLNWLNTFWPVATLQCPILILKGSSNPAKAGKVQQLELDESLLQRKCKAKLPGSIEVYCKAVPERGCQHMKFCQIFYKDGRMRLVVSSGNNVKYDYEEVENIVFVQDLPPAAERAKPAPLHSVAAQFAKLFGNGFRVDRALDHVHKYHSYSHPVPLTSANGFQDYNKWDWSKVKVKLLVTTPWAHTGDEAVDQVGLTGLSAILRNNGWVPGSGEHVEAEFQNSSLPRFDMPWMSDMYSCFSGLSPRTIASRPRPKKKPGQPAVWPPIKVVFPSLKTVDNSILGRMGGTTIFCNNGSSWTPDTASLFYDSNSKTGRVLMHTKMIISKFVPTKNLFSDSTGAGQSASFGGQSSKAVASKGINEDYGGWVYLGSHNFSKAAWGTMSMEKGAPKTYASSYEMGIVFPLPRSNVEQAIEKVCVWQRPPRKYVPGDVPWMQDLHRPDKQADFENTL